MGSLERNKGARVEREIINLLRDAGIDAERVPLSGATHYRNEGHDINVYVFGRDEPPLIFEVKARKEGAGFTLLKRWLKGRDGLVTKEDRAEPLVTLTWRQLLKLLIAARMSNIRPRPRDRHAVGTSAEHVQQNAQRRGEHDVFAVKS